MIDTNKSIEELEDDYRGEPTFGSYVVTTCHRARQKPIKFLSNEEIRCLNNDDFICTDELLTLDLLS